LAIKSKQQLKQPLSSWACGWKHWFLLGMFE
jgi:hypothetical protein